MENQSLKAEIDALTEKIIGAAIAVHRELGAGLLESAYEACLEFELIDRGLIVQRQVDLPVVYRNVRVDCGYRLDLLVEKKVIVEIKAVEKLDRIHEAQVMSYLKLTGCMVGLLIIFNVLQLIKGLKRIVRTYPS